MNIYNVTNSLTKISTLLQSLLFCNSFIKNIPIIKITLLLSLFNISVCLGQTSINTALKKQLDSIYILDQKYRLLNHAFLFLNKKDSVQKVLNIPENKILNHLDSLTTITDSITVLLVEKILDKYGYPGKSLVGEPTNKVVWYVIQHSKLIENYLKVIEQAAKTNEIPFKLYAMMLDRHLMINNKEQIYGSQLTSISAYTNGKFDESKTKFVAWPIKNYRSINKLRKVAGFIDTIEEYCKKFNVKYKHYTLKQIEIMTKSLQ